MDNSAFTYIFARNVHTMLYQLPNGKVVYMSIEDYLDLTNEDIHALVASNYGEQPSNPFFGSVIKKSPKVSEEDPHDEDIDFTPEPEQDNCEGPVDLNTLETD